MPFRNLTSRLAAIVLLLFAYGAPCVAADSALSPGELDALVAPVALYPDQLLAKVMIASTYPLEVVEAARWVDSNGNLKGSALDSSISQQNWDDSIKSLAHVPTVIKMMNERIDWTQKLGNAFLAQQQDVMNAVQRLRAQAQKNGNLKNTEQQRVEVHDQTIIIEPTQPDVVYVPYYNPQVVYGAWAYPAYPPYYWPPPPGYAYGSALAAGIGFATGVAITATFWNNAFDWNHHNVYINNNINVNNFNRYSNRTNINNINNRNNVWNHDPAHRRGVNYANNNLRQKYNRGTLPGADSRRDFRGFDNNSRGGLNNRGVAGNRSGNLNGRNAFDSRSGGLGNRSSSGINRGGNSFGQGGRGGGFDGIGNGASTRQVSSRGRASMNGGFSGSRGNIRGGGRRH